MTVGKRKRAPPLTRRNVVDESTSKTLGIRIMRALMQVASSPASLPPPKRAFYAIAALSGAAIAIVVGFSATMPNLDWYDGLAAPSFGPPAGLIVSLWSLTDLLMAWAFYRVLCTPDWMPDRPAAIRAFLIQLGLTLCWPVVFFAFQSPAGGLAVILALLAAVIATGRFFNAVDRIAGLVTLAYGLWVGFLALVALSIFIRN